MAKVAAPGSVPSNSLHFSGGNLKGNIKMRRKTPSELRGEQLKRRNAVELVDESPAPSSINDANYGLKKSELSKNPKYINTRMDEVYPSKKSRFRMLSGKDNAKDTTSIEQSCSLKNLSMLSDLAAKRRHQLSCPEDSVVSDEVSKDGVAQTRQTIEKCSQSIFRSVTELSSGGERLSGLATVDMDKALKGLAARESTGISGLPSDSIERSGDPTLIYSGKFRSECQIPGRRAPLDFTLKTNMRVVTSSSVNGFHRFIACGIHNAMPQFTSHFGCSEGQSISSFSGFTATKLCSSSKALHSWVHPQSSLPPSVVSMLTLSAAEGVEMDFLTKRQLAWEDSFRSLYYMLRKSVCNIFYVCASQFVVMFTAGDGSGRTKSSCNAYMSQSTRGLRSLLKEHDVCFSMPLCRSKVEQVTAEDLVELSEIEKHNLGQTRRLSSTSDVDNSPQSLLAFSGDANVHGLYDFLLNYKFIITSLTGADVPVLYSPVPFQNAALSAPEVRCMEMKRADNFAAPLKGPDMKGGESLQGSSAGLYSSIEIKDAYLPPWIISSICAAMGAEGKNFEASFTTEPTSIGLNVALGAACEKSDSERTAGEGLQESSYVFGIPEAIITPCMSSSSLKGLKHTNGSYTAFLSPV